MFTHHDLDLLPSIALQISRNTGANVSIVASARSSNQDLLDQFASLPQTPLAPTVLIALEQTAGRGRRGKQWMAQPGDAFLGSMGLNCTLEPSALSLLPLYMGVALARCVRLWGIHAHVKWPNDVWVNGAKLAGILLECRQHQTQGLQTAVVIGLGLNWHTAPKIEGKKTTSVTECTPQGKPLPNAVTACQDVVQAMLDGWQRFIMQAPLDFEQYDALRGLTICTDTGLSGPCVGINAQGHLGIQLEHQTQWLHSGEVSIFTKA